MRGIFWFLVGVSVTVFVVLRGKELLHRFTPQGVQEQVAEKGQELAHGFGDFVATFRVAMAEREAELRHELNIPANPND